jgi:SET domain-containing protein
MTPKKGWGVRALRPIQKGEFVIEYVGEVITDEEAEKRGYFYDQVKTRLPWLQSSKFEI